MSSQAGDGSYKDRACGKMVRVATSLGADLVWPMPGVWLRMGPAAGGGGGGQEKGGGMGLPWVEGKEENQLGGNYPAVGSGAHYAVFIEQLLIPRKRINPFQTAVPAGCPGKRAWVPTAHCELPRCRQHPAEEGWEVSDWSTVPLTENKLWILGVWDRGLEGWEGRRGSG